jgi:hypothetical protein
MTFDQRIAFFSASMAFLTFVIGAGGLTAVVIQLRHGNRQRHFDALIKLLDNNRELISLGFTHPQLFSTLAPDSKTERLPEQFYLQLWLNQFSLLHAYIKEAVVTGESRENLEVDMNDFLSAPKMRRYWHRFGKYYPTSFRERVDEILKRAEPHEAAQPGLE